MIKVTILIPKYYNDGREVPGELTGKYLRTILELCGGYTQEHDCSGACLMSNGTIAIEAMLKVWVVFADAPSRKLDALGGLAKRIAADLDQEAVYFEWEEVHVEFIHQKKG